MVKADSLTGVKCFSIGGRMTEVRQRCLGMTDEERRWRAQFLKDQVLSHDEPRYVPEYYKETNNFFRRLWKTPMNKFQQLLEPVMGADGAFLMRHGLGKILVGIALIYAGTYILKYHTNDFVPYRTLEFYQGHAVMYPDNPYYPYYPVAQRPSDYYDQGFYSSLLCQDAIMPIKDIPPPPPPETEEAVVCPALEKED